MLRLLTIIVFGFLATSVHATPPKINKARFATRATGGSAPSTTSGTLSYDVMTTFKSPDCSGATTLVTATADCYSASAYDDTCYLADYFEATSSLLNEVPYFHYLDSCTTDLKTFADNAFGDQVYLRFDYYDSLGCSLYYGSEIYIADGDCHSVISHDDNYEGVAVSLRLTVNSNATISYEFYYDNTDCTGTPDSYFVASKELLSNNACDDSGYMKLYTNLDVNGNGDGISVSSTAGGAGLSTGAIVGIAAGCFAFVVIIISLFVWRCKQRPNTANARQWAEYPTTPDRSINA